MASGSLSGAGDMASADVATAKPATLINNLIIVSSHVRFLATKPYRQSYRQFWSERTKMPTLDALYYPYINVRSVNWLKAMLLCFPHVLRMMPQGYIRRDSREMLQFSETAGESGRPLLEPVNVLDHAYIGAQQEFLARLQAHFECKPDFLIRRFSRDRAIADYGETATSFFPIHIGKFSMSLVNFLRERHLAWEPISEVDSDSFHQTWRRTRNPENRVAVHPLLGQAIMSTMAAAVATDRECDVVTDWGRCMPPWPVNSRRQSMTS
jgi:hypothetical protein